MRSARAGDGDAEPSDSAPKLHRMKAAPVVATGSELNERASFEVGGYSDTTNVNVLSPAVRGTVWSPTAGWSLGGSYLVDVVSAASPDIVSEASPPFHDVRQAGVLNAGAKAGAWSLGAEGNVSSESDYLSLGGGVSLGVDLDDKLVTPSLSVDYGHDTIGRSSTPFSVFHHTLETVVIDGGLTLVLSPSSVLLLGGTLQLERGDQSKPYRYIPMFDPAVAPLVVPGQPFASVNRARESVSPLEQLPLTRDRYALGARFAHRSGSATLRVEERLYHDSWQQSATTTDLHYLVDLSSHIRIWPHLRFNAQNGVSFYRLAYSPVIDPATNAIEIPALRTSDRENGPLLGLTAGGGLRWAFNESTSDTQPVLTMQFDVLYTKYFQALYITQRLASYGTLGFEVGFE